MWYDGREGEGGNGMGKGDVHSGHRKRVKEEFLKTGLDHMPPHRVLEFLLFFGIPQGDTNVLAHELLDEFRTLSGVFDAPYEELRKMSGVGEHTAILLKLIGGVARLYYREKAASVPTEDPLRAIGQELVAEYIGYTREVLTLVCLDNKLNILHTEQVAAGISDTVQIQFRDLARVALRHNASNVILGHNHPGGVAIPSREDKAATVALARRFDEIGIRLLDHFVIAGDEFTSMRDCGCFIGVR